MTKEEIHEMAVKHGKSWEDELEQLIRDRAYMNQDVRALYPKCEIVPPEE